MRQLIRMILVVLAVLASLAAQPAAAAPWLTDLPALQPKIACTELAAAEVAKAVKTGVTDFVASEVTGDKTYCKITGTIAPKIGFEVHLPMRGWTQRYLQTGCGGLCGSLSIRAGMPRDCTPVTNGEIVLASSDMGHRGMDGAWGNNALQREDFAHRGMHLTALAAKALIAAYYGQAPRYSYFSGCSDGGREALIAAQRYPGDFDGIAAGAPALNFTVQNSFYHAWQALSNTGKDGKPILWAADMPTLHRAALVACDTVDGLKDGQITDPRRCRFDPAVTSCKASYVAGKCLTAIQIKAARKLYDGPRDRTGKRLTLGGPMIGSELEWPGVFIPREGSETLGSVRFALDTIQSLLWTPNPPAGYRLSDFKFDAATLASMEDARALYNADNPDLSSFAAHGGKLLLWHGLSDQHISPFNTIDYYGRVGAKMGAKRRDAMLRMFLLPGVGHCSGGDGPSDIPLLATLMSWVEGGAAPEVMIARRPSNNAAPNGAPGIMAAQSNLPPRNRPIYAYPRVARYLGKGSIDSAENFEPVTPSHLPEVASWLGARK